jgi:hypothetical protein
VIVLVVSHDVTSMRNFGFRGRSGNYDIWLIVEVEEAVEERAIEPSSKVRSSRTLTLQVSN